jgi:excisionase family DNA binding protein
MLRGEQYKWRASVPNRVPFNERLWCKVEEACQVLGIGRTKLYEKMDTGEIVSKKEGRSRLIFIPSLLEKFGLRPY